VELRDGGFRSRSQDEAEGLPPLNQKAWQPINDTNNHPPGFLYFARSHRAAMEVNGMSSKNATAVSRDKWQDLADNQGLWTSLTKAHDSLKHQIIKCNHRKLPLEKEHFGKVIA